MAVLLLLVVALPGSPERGTAVRGPRRTSPLLETALADARSDHRLTRLTAVRVLGAIADPSARQVLEELRGSDDRATATAAAHALARITHAPGPLLELVNGGLDEEGAIAAMGDCTGAAFDDALKQLALPRDPCVRAAALRLFARRAPMQAVSLVREALESSEPVLRLRALDAALRAPHPTFESSLRLLADSEDVFERRLALGALARAGDVQCAARLVADADRADPWDILFVAEIAARAELPGAADEWLEAVRALPASDRVAALARLRGDVPASLRAPLRGFLEDRRAETRTSAAIVLGMEGDASGRAVLRGAAAQVADPSLAADAAVVLASLDCK